MEKWHYDNIKKDKVNKGPRAFVLALHKAGIPISRIDTNSWDDSIPSVYVNTKSGYQQFKIYRRFSKIDLKNALKHYRGSK